MLHLFCLREKYFEICTCLSSILSSSASLHWKSRQELVKVKPSGHWCTTYSFRSIWKNCSLLFFKYFLPLVSRTLYAPSLSTSSQSLLLAYFPMSRFFQVLEGSRVQFWDLCSFLFIPVSLVTSSMLMVLNNICLKPLSRWLNFELQNQICFWNLDLYVQLTYWHFSGYLVDISNVTFDAAF